MTYSTSEIRNILDGNAPQQEEDAWVSSDSEEDEEEHYNPYPPLTAGMIETDPDYVREVMAKREATYEYLREHGGYDCYENYMLRDAVWNIPIHKLMYERSEFYGDLMEFGNELIEIIGDDNAGYTLKDREIYHP